MKTIRTVVQQYNENYDFFNHQWQHMTVGTSNENIELLFLQLGTVDLTRNDILE